MKKFTYCLHNFILKLSPIRFASSKDLFMVLNRLLDSRTKSLLPFWFLWGFISLNMTIPCSLKLWMVICLSYWFMWMTFYYLVHLWNLSCLLKLLLIIIHHQRSWCCKIFFGHSVKWLILESQEIYY